MIAPPFPMCAVYRAKRKSRDGTEYTDTSRVEVVGFDDDGDAWIIDEGDSESRLAKSYAPGFWGIERSHDNGTVVPAHPGWFVVSWWNSTEEEPGRPGAELLPIVGWLIYGTAMTPVVNHGDDGVHPITFMDNDSEYFGRIYGPGQYLPDVASLEVMAIGLHEEKKKRDARTQFVKVLP